MNVARYACVSVFVLGWMATSLAGCRRTSPGVTAPPQKPMDAVANDPVVRETAVPVVDSGADTDATPETAPLVEPGWVQVEVLRPKVDGGWATGDFLEARNKIEIKTRGVKQFSIDLSKLRINWDRLVVIGIDGRNAELRRRNTDLLHIARDDHGKWVVLEP